MTRLALALLLIGFGCKKSETASSSTTAGSGSAHSVTTGSGSAVESGSATPIESGSAKGSAPLTPPTTDPAASKAANNRGVELLKQKKWAEAAAEFKAAIAADASSVKAHYNLACAASRAQDLETAVWELAWVGDRAAWDAEAKAAQKKAPDDADLRWAVTQWGMEGAAWLGDSPTMVLIDLEKGESADIGGRALADAQRDKIAALLAAAPGAHDAKCDAKDAKQGKVFGLTLQLEALRNHQAVASLKDGVALVDPSGKLIARSEPLECTGPGESQDQLSTIVFAFGVPDAITINTPHHPNPAADLSLIAVSYSNGGRREWQSNLAVFARRDKALVKVFEGLLSASDANSVGHVWQTPRGNLVYSGPGETKKHPFGWDQAAFKFVPIP